jgi:pimeloyl-ACP methyl ester carboxylesterase
MCAVLPVSGCLPRWRLRPVPTAGRRPGCPIEERVCVLARRYSHRVPGPVDIPPDQFVILDGVRFHYLDWGGDGEPALFLAGLGCTAHVFAELAPHLSDRFRVIALTRRGHGLTDQVQSGYALVDAAEDARRLLDAVGIERAHVVGHSMGGGEVSALAARHPGRVDRIVYLDGAYDWADSPTSEWPEEAASRDRFASYEDYVDFVHSLFADDIRGPAFDAMLRTSVDIQADGSVVDKLSGSASAPFVEALKAFRHPYSDITAPALAVFALGDQWQGAEAAWRVACRDRFVDETANARVIELRASHYLFIDRRDDVLKAMRAFLT